MYTHKISDITVDYINHSADDYIESNAMYDADLHNNPDIIKYLIIKLDKLKTLLLLKNLHNEALIRKTMTLCNVRLLHKKTLNQTTIIENKLAELTHDYVYNIRNSTKEITLSREDLSGLSEDKLKKWINSDNVYVIIINIYNSRIILNYCSNRKTRELIMHELNNISHVENEVLFDDIMKLRHKLAELRGYHSHTAYALRDNVYTSPDEICKVLSDLSIKIKPMLLANHNDLLMCSIRDGISELYTHDMVYYVGKCDTTVKEYYFSPHKLISGVFKIFSAFYTCEYINVTADYIDKLWNDDVLVYQYITSDKKAYLFLDLYYRPGKKINAHIIRKTYKYTDNIVIMVCNFEKNKYLSLNNVKTYFHEFGHAMHRIIDNDNYITPDMIEFPSKLFENWVYSPSILKILNPELTDDDISHIKRDVNKYLFYQMSDQISKSILDLTIYSKIMTSNECNRYYTTLFKDTTGIILSDDHNFIQSFDHIIDGYRSIYYSYLLSGLLAKYIYRIKFMGHEMDPSAGKEYMEKVLISNGRNFRLLIIDYLGYFPTNEQLLEDEDITYSHI